MSFRILNLILISLIPTITCNIEGASLFQGLVDQWLFSYKLVSGNELEYLINDDNNINFDSFKLLNSEDIDWENNLYNPNIYIVPITGYSIAIVHTITALGNQSLYLTENAIRRIISDQFMLFSDPEISEFNPLLSSVNIQARMALDSSVNEMNRYLINYFFPNTSNNGSWSEIRAPRHALFNGIDAVMSAMTVLTNYMAFVPFPLLNEDISKRPKPVRLLLINESYSINETYSENNTMIAYKNVSINDKPIITINDRFNNIVPAILQTDSNSWPLNQIVYFIFPESLNHCENITIVLRFIYWVLNTKEMNELMGTNGYFDTSEESKDYVKNVMKNATCINEDGKPKIILSYTNLADKRRNSIVFGVSITCIMLFIALVIYALYLSQKLSKMVYLHNLIVVIGLVLIFISFFIYWWPASTTLHCRSRYWTLSLGYVNVISSIFIWAFNVHYFVLNKKIKSYKSSKYAVILAHLILNLLNIILLLIWTLIGKPVSREVIVSVFDWTTIYECYSETMIPDYLITSYYLIISTVGCIFLYSLWKTKTVVDVKKTTPDDIRFLMVCLYNQISVFLLIFVIKNLKLTDDQDYEITIPLFVFLVANVILSSFVPKILAKVRSNLSAAKSEDGSTDRKTKDKSQSSYASRRASTIEGVEMPEVV